MIKFRHRLLNKRLNASEDRLRKRIGASKVDGLVRDFKAAAIRSPMLLMMLYEQSDPYRWLAEEWARWGSPPRRPSAPPYPTQPRQ
jgi:hypothetical protein